MQPWRSIFATSFWMVLGMVMHVAGTWNFIPRDFAS